MNQTIPAGKMNWQSLGEHIGGLFIFNFLPNVITYLATQDLGKGNIVITIVGTILATFVKKGTDIPFNETLSTNKNNGEITDFSK